MKYSKVYGMFNNKRCKNAVSGNIPHNYAMDINRLLSPPLDLDLSLSLPSFFYVSAPPSRSRLEGW